MPMIKVYQNLMGENEKWAQATRRLLQEKKISMINLIGSPGSGKTTLVEHTIRHLAGSCRIAVLEGDVETTRDAERLAPLGIPVAQLLTSGACHLEAKLVHQALSELPLDQLDLVVVENVGNLVCPAEFDVGENSKIAVLSVTEGEDKPLKYPLLFREAQALVLTKIDLLPHLSYDVGQTMAAVEQVHPRLPVFQVASTKGTGMAAWSQGLMKIIHFAPRT